MIENISPFSSHFTVDFPSEEEAVDEFLPDHWVQVAGHSTMSDERIESHTLHELANTDDFFEGRLALYFPSATPEEIIEGDRQSFVVELTNWITTTARAIGLVVQ